MTLKAVIPAITTSLCGEMDKELKGPAPSLVQSTSVDTPGDIPP